LIFYRNSLLTFEKPHQTLHDITNISLPLHRNLKIFELVWKPPRLVIRPYSLIKFLTFGLERDEVKRDWKKIHNEELNDLCCTLNNVWLIKSKRTRWVNHVALMGGWERCIQGFGVGYLTERDNLEDLGGDGRIILKLNFRMLISTTVQ